MRLRILVILAFAVVAPLVARAQTISTVVGGGPINLPQTAASIGAPAAVRQDAAGNTYILDNQYGRVYKVDHATGNMSVYAGNGVIGFSGEGGPAVNAAMDGPSGMCFDANDDLFIADSDNAVIREIPATAQTFPFAMAAGNIYTVAGQQMETDYIWGGDGGLATSANLHFPDGCSFDSNGNLYIADRGNNEIRIVIGSTGKPPASIPADTTPGHIYLFAGSAGAVTPTPPAPGYAANGTAANNAALNGPFDVFVDSHDNVFIADLGNVTTVFNNVIREVPATAQTFPFAMVAGDIYTVAGVHGAAGAFTATPVLATLALLNGPIGISVDATGNLFFADQGNQVIREVAGATPPAGMTAGFVYVVAGSGSRGYAGDGGLAIAASMSFPAGTLVDSTDSIYIADSSSNAIRQVASNTDNYITELISTFAGNGRASYSGNGALAVDGQLNNPAGLAIGSTGTLAIADWGNDLIRGVSAPISTGDLSTLAGEPEFNGFLGDGTPPPSVINNSLGVVFDPSGNLFIADTDNCIVREITGGNIVTVAGTDPTTPDPSEPQNTTPVCGFSGATGPATSAVIGNVNGVALDAAGDIFFSDSTNNIIWEVPKTTTVTMTAGHIYVVVGTQSLTGNYGGDGGPATAAQLNFPTGIFFDIHGNLFISDTNNNVIREVSAQNTSNPSRVAGNIYPVAGNQGMGAGYTGDNGPATSATLDGPFTVVVDNADNIFIADTSNEAIREVTASNGHINTVAGTGTPGFGGDGGPAIDAEFSSPEGLALDGAGDLLVGDFDNNRVRSITTLGNMAAVPVAIFNPSSVTFLPQPLNIASNTEAVTLSNNGGAALTGIAVSITGAEAGDFSQTDTCAGTLNPGLSCTITVTFKPTVVGARSAQVSIADNSLGSPQTVALSGNGISGTPKDVLNPNALTFTSELVGVASTPQTITLSNMTGTAPLSIAVNGIAIGGAEAGDFSATNTCGVTASTGGTVAVGATCSINVTFKPTSATPLARTAAITLTDNAADSGQMVTLNGTVIAVPTATPSSSTVTFSDQFVGTTSTSAQKITLTNTSTSAALNVASVTLDGANPGDYGQTNTCSGKTIAANSGTCTITVTFTPTTTGARPASITITDNASPTTQTITLAGNGFNISLVAAANGALSQTVQPGQTATYNLQFNTTGGASTDTVNVGLACSGAPALVTLTCPSTEAAPGTFTITAVTTGSGMLAPPSQPAPKMQPPAALRTLPLTLLAVLLFIAAMLAWMQSPAGRMRTVRLALTACLVLLPMSASMLLTGCASSGSSPAPTPTPTPTPSTAAGTYTITVTATVTGAKPQTTALTLIVQ
jgi:trimeric autotransporter adhesin